jgi:DNA-directed RNA polymerase specialized sigma24 family protein
VDERTGLSEQEYLTLYRDTGESLLRFFVRRTFDPQTAADLTAETYAAAFASRRSFEPDRGDARAWLLGSPGTYWGGT